MIDQLTCTIRFTHGRPDAPDEMLATVVKGRLSVSNALTLAKDERFRRHAAVRSAMLRLSVDHMNAEALFKRRSERIKAGLRLRRERLAKAAELSKGVRTPEEPQ